MPAKLSCEERLVLIKRVIEKKESVTKVCKEAGVSRVVFYRWLKKYRNTQQELQNNKNQKIAVSSSRISPQDRLKMIERVKAGEKVTNICGVYGISRTIFYRWLRKYELAETTKKLESLWDKKPEIERYYKQASEEYEEVVLSAVRQYPELSSHKLVWVLPQIGGRPILGNHGVQNVLRRHNLNTYQDRLAYAQTVNKASIFVKGVKLAREVFDSLMAQRPETRNVFVRYSSLFSIVGFSLVVLLGLGGFLKLIFTAPSIALSIGYIFASVALLFGMFFFLYSLKYYITIAIVLSFSRHREQDVVEKSIGSFLGNIFGVSVEVVDQEKDSQPSPSVANYQLGGGLQPDLSQVKLERFPFVSIHLSTYNEKRVIDRLLTAATSMEYDNYEVIVADDSTDETVDILKKWADHPRVKVVHRADRTGYKGAALGNALNHIDPRTEFIIVFDADFIPYPDTIIQFLKYFQSSVGSLDQKTVKASTIAAVQGYQWHVLNKSENWVTRGVRSEYAGSYVIERSGIEIYGGLKQIAGSVYIARADVIKQIGWGSSITEDFELTLRLYAQGYKVVYTPYIQAPAEAVSTIKRLIRQRMRWSEGHSYNIKKMFRTLVLSKNLTLAEKFEVLYLSPYYLQAFFFILGTLCWFIAEVVFQTRLPFWTEVLGWSLILTNLFALPLVNMVGLFLEESEERDYFGLFSFIALSYIVAPFQAYSSIKGFIEEKEGPWFRTPKTGRITDTFVPGRFYRFISGIFGKPSIAHSLASHRVLPTHFATFSSNPATDPWEISREQRAESREYGVQKSISSGFFDWLKHPAVALATANNTFQSMRQQGFKLSRRQTRTVVNRTIVVMVLVSILLTFAAVPISTTNASYTGTFYFRNQAADYFATTSTAKRQEMTDATIGSSTQTFTINSTNTTFYVLTDNANKMWSTDIKVANSTTGDKRSVDVAQDSDGNTYMVWEDSRNSQSANDNFVATSRNMTVDRRTHASSLLSNGNVLITGGRSSSAALSSAELYDPTGDTFTATTGNMSIGRYRHSSTVLNNGISLIVGGFDGTVSLSTAETYDPFTNTFTATTNNMVNDRHLHTATLLGSGKVLIAGGDNDTVKLSGAELYDPGRKTFQATTGGMKTLRREHAATLLNNGKVLITGGTDGTTTYSSAELYDPTTSNFSFTLGNLSTNRRAHTATLLNNGKVLITGGTNTTTDFSTADLYDPSSDTFTQTTGNLSTMMNQHEATLLNNGKILVTGGATGSTIFSIAQLYDPSSNTFKDTSGGLTTTRFRHNNVLLNNGKVLAFGGCSASTCTSDTLSTAELYAPRTYDVYAQKYDKTGAAQWGSGTDVKVNSDDGSKTTQSGNPSNYDHLNPGVKLDSSNNPIVVWQESRNSAYGDDIYAQKLQGTDGAKLWPASSSSTDRFTTTSNNLATSRQQIPIALLQNGKVLIPGGLGAAQLSSADVYDPSANTFSATSNNMTTARSIHTATVLANGKVLIAGGYSGAARLSSADLYNPVANTFAATGNMATMRQQHQATLLQSGKVLITGGSTDGSGSLSTAELYDPSVGTFSATSNNMPVSRKDHTATLLNNGKVLLAGGSGSTADLYNPVANTFAATGSMSTGRQEYGATLLNNGKVLIAGGNTGAVYLSTAQLYDPTTGTFSATTGNMSGSRSHVNGILLPSGKVLLAAGYNGSSNLSTAELFDPSVGTFSATTNNLSTSKRNFKPVLLHTGKVLLPGGVGAAALSTADLYTPAGDIQVSNDGSPTNGYGLPRPEYPNTSKGILGEQRNPALAVDGGGSVAVVWEGTKMGAFQNWDVKFDFATTATFQGNPNFGGLGICSGGGGMYNSCGGKSAYTSNPVRIMGQKLSSSTGAKNWGDENSSTNQNNPQDVVFSATGDENRSPSVALDSSNNVIVTWQSNGGDLQPVTAYKDSDIYTQKFDSTNGKPSWGGSFTATSNNLLTARHSAGAVLLGNGKVFTAGGCITADCTAYTGTSRLYDPQTDQWTSGANFTTTRAKHTTTFMSYNQRVLLTGGCRGTACNTELSNSQIYDPVANSWTNGPNFVGTRMLHAAAELTNGLVLASGGCNTYTTAGCSSVITTAVMYNPQANTFAATTGGQVAARILHQMSLLNTGKALLMGGCNGASHCATVLSSSELFDPTTGRYTASGNMTTARHEFTSSLLNDGKVLVTGGCTDTGEDCSTVITTAELYNPLTGTFAATTGGLATARARHTATLLNNGRVLLAGGCRAATSNCDTLLSSAEIYDPITDRFTALSTNMTGNREIHSAALMANGKVMFVGGCSANTTGECSTLLSSAEVFSYDQKITNGVDDQMNPQIAYDSSTDDFYYVWQGRKGDGNGSGNVNGGNGQGGSWKIYGQRTDNPASGTLTNQWPTGTTNVFTTTTGGLNVARENFAATSLMNGKILIAGGDSATSAAELYDPSSGSFTLTTGGLNTQRRAVGAALLNTGKVLVPGGHNGTSQQSSAELYDPTTDRFTLTGNMATPRSDYTLALLQSGKVLVAGGQNASGTAHTLAELYDPSTGTFAITTGGMVVARDQYRASVLLNGKVLLTGGSTNGVSTAEVYDPITNSFTATTGNMNTPRSNHTSTLLSNGKVLLVGGIAAAGPTNTTVAELYNPITGIFTTTTGGLITNRRLHAATLLNNGKVFINGGCSDAGCTNLSSAELYDPITQRFTATTGNMPNSRRTHSSFMLTTGKVLSVGASGSTTAELYNPAGEMMLAHDFAIKGDQTYPSITFGNSALFAAWQDLRPMVESTGTSISTDSNAFMQKFDTNGIPQWPAATTARVGYTSPYAVMDIRADTYGAGSGGTGSHYSGKPRLGGVTAELSDNSFRMAVAYEDNRNDSTDVTSTQCGYQNSSTLVNICAQNYDTQEYNISQSTNWQAIFYMSSPTGSPTVSVDSAITEWDGYQAAKRATAQTWGPSCSPSCPSEQTITWTTGGGSPPPSDTVGNVTMRRLQVRFTYASGTSVVLSYDNTGVESRLGTGAVVPENLLLFGLLIPFLPPMMYYISRRRGSRERIIAGLT